MLIAVLFGVWVTEDRIQLQIYDDKRFIHCALNKNERLTEYKFSKVMVEGNVQVRLQGIAKILCENTLVLHVNL